jgi:hypothetical protein
MFGRSKPVVFTTYGRRRPGWRLPRWAWLLLAGIGAGAAAVVGIQERYLPPRLSASASAEVRDAFEQADGERTRLRGELGEARRRLELALSMQTAVTDALAASRTAATRLREDLASVIASLPPDPRDGKVAVRAGRFTAKDGVLNYDLVLTREAATGKPLPGTLQLLVAGESERGTQALVTPKAVALSVGSHEVVRGSVPLPPGFKPRQTTIQVLDQTASKPLGMRVLPIK